MSWASAKSSKDYQEIEKSLEGLNEDSLGFIRIFDLNTGVTSYQTAVIKQNNFIIQQLFNIKQLLQQQKGQSSNGNCNNDISSQLKDITEKLAHFSIEKRPIKEKTTPFMVFADPRTILRQEIEKLKAQQQKFPDL